MQVCNAFPEWISMIQPPLQYKTGMKVSIEGSQRYMTSKIRNIQRNHMVFL